MFGWTSQVLLSIGIICEGNTDDPWTFLFEIV